MGTGEGILVWIKAICGTVVLGGLVVWATFIFLKRTWSDYITLACAAIVTVGVVFFTDQTIALLKWLWEQFLGGGTA